MIYMKRDGATFLKSLNVNNDTDRDASSAFSAEVGRTSEQKV